MGFKAGGEASSRALLAGRWGEAKSPLSAPDVSAAGCPPPWQEAAQQFTSPDATQFSIFPSQPGTWSARTIHQVALMATCDDGDM